ncbi:MAG TPA: site-2 protease family protein [Candidatus Binatia bacterium]|nr:site-2 protease family protein [Candidatus Binatia bacterium]
MNGPRDPGIELFRVAGVQIAIDWSWLVIFLLVLWSLAAGYFPRAYPGYGRPAYLGIGAAATCLFFASVLLHELAHAVVGNRLGERVRRITLFVFGGMAHLSGEPATARTELRIAAVGPLTSLVLAGVFWGGSRAAAATQTTPLVVAMLEYLAAINLALALFNLLPGFPLDGGRILRSVLWMRSKDLRQATARAADWGVGIAFGLIGLGVVSIFGGSLVGGLWLVFIGMFLRGAARTSYENVVVTRALGGARVRDVMITDPVTVPADASVEEAVESGFLRHGFGGFPVSEGGRVAGLVSLRDVLHCPAADRRRRRVRDVMQPLGPELAIPARASVGDALRRMTDAQVGRLLVTDDGHVVGLVTRTGIVRFVQFRTELERS